MRKYDAQLKSVLFASVSAISLMIIESLDREHRR